ncbi:MULTISPECIES: hypothetical protein [unclassified Flavobacterium]|jgi:hypothetical protein|uniref:hypothetical protein n=1 Tax=unclassified Flavobacterium TaxID=196869 RepID=UPI0013F3AB75|nr:MULTISPECIES: hypothetical protein [unclassified Flavobacterium]MEA9415294.1 hypothetical protein [Flavobacterium sp. PL02]
MGIEEIVRLIIPLISIVMGFAIKNSKNESYTSMKKYWWFFVVIGMLLFSYRLYKFLYH